MGSTGGHEANEEEKLILSLRRERGWSSDFLCLFQEFWCTSTVFQAVNSSQKYFQGKDSDVVVASFPKSGTTWLKALTFAIVNHQHFSLENHPLLTSNPHELVGSLEYTMFRDGKTLLPSKVVAAVFNMIDPMMLKDVKRHNKQELRVSCEDFNNIIASSPGRVVYKGTMKDGLRWL
ncbi:Cytosolic sulfotransferase 15 [Spatholobus suberectus]|nr:Cytosolic sulfotransferase 15 [Spatholobus suberectus]